MPAERRPDVVVKVRTKLEDIQRRTKKGTPPLPFDTGWRPPSIVGMSKLTLQGNKLTSMIGPRVILAALTQTLDEPLSLKLQIWDRERTLLKSGLLDTKLRVRLSDQGFAMTRVSKAGDLITLEFEDSKVNALRQLKKPLKATRGTVTRIEFVKRLLDEKGAPELRRYVSAGAAGEVSIDKNPLALKPLTKRKPGPFARTKVKDAQADPDQLDNLRVVLGWLYDHQATNDELIMTVMCVTAESTWHNNPGGSGGSVGLFQQTLAGGYTGYDRTDRERATEEWFTRLKKAEANVAGSTVAKHIIIQAVQRSGAGKATAGAANYGPWEEEATRTVSAWSGAYGAAHDPTINIKQYEFRRGNIDGTPENSWECLGRLADEVQYRRFVIEGVFYFLPDELLVATGPRMLLTEKTQGMLTPIDFDFDEGYDPQSATFSMRSGDWSCPVGACIELEDMGPANGVWLVNKIEGDLFQPHVQQIELVRPRAVLTEPPDDQTVDPDTQMGGGRVNEPTDNPDTGVTVFDPPFKGNTVGYPLSKQAKVGGGPYEGTHGKAFNIAGGSDNWESENAVDLLIDYGTPVLAVADGTIGGAIGSLGSGGRFAGLRVHLETSDNEFYYAHLSRLDVVAGQQVTQGTVLGLSGRAGPNHLHFASEHGDPRDLIGQH